MTRILAAAVVLGLSAAPIAVVALSAVPITAPVDSSLEAVAGPLAEACEYRTTIVLAVGQTRTIDPAFFDEGNRPAKDPENIEWRFGPASIGAVLPIFGTADAEIRGDAVGMGTLQLIDLSTGAVLATADVCVFAPGAGTEAVRAELDME